MGTGCVNLTLIFFLNGLVFLLENEGCISRRMSDNRRFVLFPSAWAWESEMFWKHVNAWDKIIRADMIVISTRLDATVINKYHASMLAQIPGGLHRVEAISTMSILEAGLRKSYYGIGVLTKLSIHLECPSLILGTSASIQVGTVWDSTTISFVL